MSELIDVPWMVYPLVVAALLLMVFFPRITKVVPAPLASIVALAALRMVGVNGGVLDMAAP